MAKNSYINVTRRSDLTFNQVKDRLWVCHCPIPSPLAQESEPGGISARITSVTAFSDLSSPLSTTEWINVSLQAGLIAVLYQDIVYSPLVYSLKYDGNISHLWFIAAALCLHMQMQFQVGSCQEQITLFLSQLISERILFRFQTNGAGKTGTGTLAFQSPHSFSRDSSLFSMFRRETGFVCAPRAQKSKEMNDSFHPHPWYFCHCKTVKKCKTESLHKNHLKQMFHHGRFITGKRYKVSNEGIREERLQAETKKEEDREGEKERQTHTHTQKENPVAFWHHAVVVFMHLDWTAPPDLPIETGGARFH